MPEHPSHDDYIASLRQKAVEVAQDMLSGKRSFLEGALAIPNPLEPGENRECENAFQVFALIRSDTDSLPIVDRKFWSAEALQKLSPEISAAESWARDIGTEACNVIINHLGA